MTSAWNHGTRWGRGLLATAALSLGGCAFTVSLGDLDVGVRAPDAAGPVVVDAGPVAMDATTPPTDATSHDAGSVPDRVVSDAPLGVDGTPGDGVAIPDRWVEPDRPVVIDPDCVARGVEVCNGIDDDCDGRVDDMAPVACAFSPCAAGVLACPEVVAPGVLAAPQCRFTELLPAGTICRQAVDPCDVAERCTGTSVACPEDGFGPEGVVCRRATSGCGIAGQVCTGGPRPTCSSGTAIAPGSACGSDRYCNISGECSPCGLNETMCGGRCREMLGCTAGLGECAVTGVLRCQPGGVMGCVAAFQGTPTPEVCDGYDNDCDGLVDEGYCRIDGRCFRDGDVGPSDRCQICDAPLSVSGPTTWSARPAGTVCRASTGPCDLAEVCDGASCPVDRFVAAGTVCRGATGGCDLAESCTGSGGACPPDALAAAGTVCRSSRGVCDPAESCSGSAAACPDDAVSPVGTACGAGLTCDVAGACGDCPSGQTACGGRCVAAGGACTSGVGACARSGIIACLSTGVVGCSAVAGAPSAEVCDGLDNDCDGIVDEGFCRVGGRCFADGDLNPSNACQSCVAPPTEPSPTAWSDRPAGAVCRGSTLQAECDPEERCPGGGAPCPANVVARRPVPESCDGVDNDCDGVVDEELSRPCYTGPADTEGIGACRGGARRCAAGAWGACEGEVLPQPETCNYRDDDCDNVYDNGACL